MSALNKFRLHSYNITLNRSFTESDFFKDAHPLTYSFTYSNTCPVGKY